MGSEEWGVRSGVEEVGRWGVGSGERGVRIEYSWMGRGYEEWSNRSGEAKIGEGIGEDRLREE